MINCLQRVLELLQTELLDKLLKLKDLFFNLTCTMKETMLNILACLRPPSNTKEYTLGAGLLFWRFYHQVSKIWRFCRLAEGRTVHFTAWCFLSANTSSTYHFTINFTSCLLTGCPHFMFESKLPVREWNIFIMWYVDYEYVHSTCAIKVTSEEAQSVCPCFFRE